MAKIALNKDIKADLNLPREGKQAFWQWYRVHEGDWLVKVKVGWGIRFKVKVRDLRRVFDLFFGG